MLMCVRACAGVGVGGLKGAVRLRFGTLPDLGCSSTAEKQTGRKKQGKRRKTNLSSR